MTHADDRPELADGYDFHDVTGLRGFDDVAVPDVHADVLRVGWFEAAVAAGYEDQVAGREQRWVGDRGAERVLRDGVMRQCTPAAAQAAMVRPEQS
jgi:hypothetical protein